MGIDLSGMDVQQVGTLAGQLETQAKAINSVIGAVDGVVSGLMDVWSGEDMDAFASAWRQGHRPAATGVAGQLQDYVAQLRVEIEQQQAASDIGGAVSGSAFSALMAAGLLGAFGQSTPLSRLGDPTLTPSELEKLLEAGGVGGVGAILTTLPSSFQKAWDETGSLRTVENLAEDVADGQLISKYGSDWEKYENTIMSPEFRKVAGTLGVIGGLMDVAGLAEGVSHHDETQTDYEALSVGADVGDFIPGPDIAAMPLTAALGAYSLMGLPTSDAQATSVSDQAVIDHFGPSVNINKLTPTESEWLGKRYTGIAAPWHAVQDGIRYQLDTHFGL